MLITLLFEKPAMQKVRGQLMMIFHDELTHFVTALTD